ncbi:hypothetical protein FQN57_003775 [Myotisia sp. PD_48]|nr:hypothetical protein FQN57_003775 [Myotisia sp. PD_48]
MPFPTPTAIFVAAVLLYISTFVLFAIIRIATGISIQRIGYFSLRHVAYSPREGVHLGLRGIRLSFHRPSLAQPTYISVRFSRASVTLDPNAIRGLLHGSRGNPQGQEKAPQAPTKHSRSDPDTSRNTKSTNPTRPRINTSPGSLDKTWKALTSMKDKIKRLHRRINWLALVDVSASETTLRITNVVELHIGAFMATVDTRRQALQSGQLFRYKKETVSDRKSAEWIFNIRNVLLVLDGNDHKEILDNMTINIHGLLREDVEGLREVSVSVKVGRLHFPLDDMRTVLKWAKEISLSGKPVFQPYSPADIDGDDDISTLGDILEEQEEEIFHEEAIVHSLTESKEFLRSLLSGIHEFQLAMSFFRISSTLQLSTPAATPLYLNLVTHEAGIDLHQMDPAHPSHRMYFQRDDIAHQALLAALSSSISLGEKIDEHDKIFYIPMATTTIKTTLPSKTMTISSIERDAAERNSNVLFANFVITSPSIDLAPRHLSHILTIAQAIRPPAPTSKPQNKHLLMSRLLPRASIKLSVHEPVLRFSLPTSTSSDKPDYNLLVSSISSISLDVESSHSAEEGVHYSLISSYRVSSHLLYYQTAAGVRYRLLATDSMELKAYINATTEVCVAITGSLNSYSVHMVGGEVTRGIHQIVEQIRDHFAVVQKPVQDDPSQSLLRRLPSWLIQFQFETTMFSIEIAGIDETVGSATRGIVLHLGGWSIDYQLHKSRPNPRSIRRRTPSHSAISDDASFRFAPSSPTGKGNSRPADGRRLTINARGLEAFIMESADFMEPDAFLSMPRFEVTLTTSSDLHGPIFHVNAILHETSIRYSLYRYYAIAIAVSVLKDTFPLPIKHSTRPSSPHSPKSPKSFASRLEITTFDIKAPSIQVQATMPQDPRMLLQVFGLVAGRHRWSPPFLRSHNVRLHVENRKLKRPWTRIVSVGGIRAGLRETRTKQAETFSAANSYDISTDFIRLAVPHHMIMYQVFDNFVNTVKAIEQLHHRFKTRSQDSTFHKPPAGPKHVPRLNLHSKTLVFELEDDPFEWKLGCIYRLGVQEQQKRLAREEAYLMKLKKVEETQQRIFNSRFRNQSARAATEKPSTRVHKTSHKRRSASLDNRDRARHRSSSRGRNSKRKGRYHPPTAAQFSDSCNTEPESAWIMLQIHNFRQWKSKIDRSTHYQNPAIGEIRRLFAEADVPPPGMEDDHRIAPIPDRPGLLTVRISDVNLALDGPSFPLKELPQYLHRIGKGMPLDMQYALLIPMSIRLEMGEARANLRDYPLDLIHIPALGLGQSGRVSSWSAKSDFVIAEEFRDHESLRQVMVNVVPPNAAEIEETNGFSVEIRRTVAPVKTYSNPTIEINTNLPTAISWSMSYQPVIQDMMKIMENFTKPEIDPSERVGFWDKIRLSFHSRIKVIWKGDGDVHLKLKGKSSHLSSLLLMAISNIYCDVFTGSRDPYEVTGFGAGFVMCWRKDILWEIHMTDDPKEFMAVTSGEYVLAIPDYSRHARYSQDIHTYEGDLAFKRGEPKDPAIFKKVIMKLSGNVRWLAGLVFERNNDGRDRCFDFKPHYNVILRNPKYLDANRLKGYDAFGGFRSNHIHLSVAVVAPVSRVWSLNNREPSTSYNTVHLSPRFFTHFFSWWSLFSGVMSLPIRQGPLFPGLTKTSKKFSRHLGTVKYNLFLSPLFVAHIYKHKDAEEYSEDMVFATGLKVRLDSFMLDLHQRREQVRTLVKGRSQQINTSTMKINRAQLDFIAADFRAVSSSIGGTALYDMKDTSDIASALHQSAAPIDLSRFTIPDEDYNWVDMDDFVELDWILPSELNPRTRILPLAYSPRFSYFRQTDHTEVGPEEPGYSPFGDEPTHFCVMSEDNDPRQVQMDLIKERLAALEAQISSQDRMLGDHELRTVREGSTDEASQAQHELLVNQANSLQQRQVFLQHELARLEHQLKKKASIHSSRNRTKESGSDDSSTGKDKNRDCEADPMCTTGDNEDFDMDFDNRFIIHNIQLKWNNSLRNIILRYIHQVSRRRGFVYYMSRRAVKFILDIVEEQGKSKLNSMGRTRRASTRAKSTCTRAPSMEQDDDMSVEDRIEALLRDADRFVNADESAAEDGTSSPPASSDRTESISPEFTPQNSYYLRLIAPQIQLQSEKNKKSVALVTAKSMQLKVVSIMDKHRVSDDVSGLIQRQFTLNMDSAQFFVARQQSFSSHISIYCGNRYGNAPASAWPPWVSLESMWDFDVDLAGFSRIIQKTSASLRYDKYNTLRLKYNERVASGNDKSAGCAGCLDGNEHRIDQISVDFPQIRAICDSSQYYSMYIIVLDLLLYSDPLEQIRGEKLEKIMLASDFSDLRGAPEMVNKLQQRIRYLEEIRTLFQIQGQSLDNQGWADRVSLEKDLATCEDELFFIMKAITTSQRKADDRPTSYSGGLLRWTLAASEIVWHLMTDHKQPLAEFQLRNAAYERTDNIDGSNHNTIDVGDIYGLNLLQNALYPQVILPYVDEQRGSKVGNDGRMLQVKWYMLEAIAGIPVLDNFEVALFPLKIQLERELSQKLFEYVFPGMGSHAFENGGFSPFMIKQISPIHDSDSDEVSEPTTPGMSTGSTSADDSHSISQLGAVEHRLTPTLSLPDKRRPNSPGGLHPPPHKDADATPRARNVLRARHRSPSRSPGRIPIKKPSADSLRFVKRQASDRSLTSQAGNEDKNRKFGISRQPTAKDLLKAGKSVDDVSHMMSRASNYMILSHVKIKDVVLCLSYKGKGERNIEDIHNFVFRLPILEYRHKTWSNLDLALRLKKDAMKALISHAPAILGNKFSHSRPTKQQQSRLRELASSSQVLSVADGQFNPNPSPSDGSNSFISRTSTERSNSPALSHRSQDSSIPGSRQIPSVPGTASSAHFPLDSSSLKSATEEREQTPGFKPSFFPGRLASSRTSLNGEPAGDDVSEKQKRKPLSLLGRKLLGSSD